MSVGYPGGGLTTSLDVLPGVRQNILVPVQSNYGGLFRITATQGVGLDSFELAYQSVQGEGTYMFIVMQRSCWSPLIRVHGSTA